MAGNIIGEPIDSVILKQIDYRQSVSGAGYNSKSPARSTEILNILNNRNAWVKMASGVSLGQDAKFQLETISEQEGGFLTTDEINNLLGTGLAKNLVLFNTIQSFEGKEKDKYVNRSGVRNNNLLQDSLNKMYGGIGGNSQGLQPVGGITDISVENINRGSLAKATVNIKVYNRFQFNLIELAYLKLGYIMILEWGWDKYISEIDNNKVTVVDMSSTIIEKSWFSQTGTQQQLLNKIDQLTIQHQGNYSGFFGKVSNFSWKANKDGSYDISIDLLTLGSVIESLKINLSEGIILDEAIIKNNQALLADRFDQEATDEGTYDSPLINNMGNNTLSQFLGLCILNFPIAVTNDFTYSPALGVELVPFSYGDINSLSIIPGIGAPAVAAIAVFKYLTGYTSNIPEEDRYYIRLGLFLDQVQKLGIPYIVNEGSKPSPSLKIDTNVSNNICNYVINLVPLNPSICIFSIKLDQDFEDSTYLDVGNYNSNLKEFVIEKDNVVWGQIMNIQMNINFLTKIIDENTDEDGNLSLYALLEGICNGINECTGGTTNLEPAIRDQRVVYILEQNPIKGKGSNTTDTAPIEILGYSPNGQSNFVQDFSFNTKITPDMMSMISIGAVSEGVNGREVDAAPWKKWYKGITNRFEENYEKNKTTETSISSLAKSEAGLTPSASIIERFQSDLRAGNIDYDHIVAPGYDWEWNGHDIADIDPDGEFTLGFRSDAVNADNKALLAEVVERVWEVERKDKAYQEKQEKKGNKITVVGDADEVPIGQEYKQYFINAFGGNTGLAQKNSFFWGYSVLDVDRDDGLWWYGQDNSSFIARGKNSFKAYITSLNNEELKNKGTGSSLNGFIPVELSLTVDGISGVKIYNKLEVNQRFLPAAYPKALRFVIRGVNHKIENNQWTTELATISTTINDVAGSTRSATVTNKKDSPNTPAGDPQTPVVIQGPIPPLNPNEKLKIFDNRTVAGVPFDKRTYKTFQSIEWLVGELNDNYKEKWRGFLNVLNDRYPGYTLLINATYRTYLRSIQLKVINSDNASAGSSPHNYAFAVDMNIKDPKGVVYRKPEKSKWEKSGIPKIAVEEFGMRWGGNFSNYLDCVHFDVSRATSKVKSNAAADNKGLPRKQWYTKNTSPT